MYVIWVARPHGMGSKISSHLKLFAGDALLYAIIYSQADALSLQSDLNQLVAWSQIWQTNFHPSKYYVLRIHRSKNPIAHQYTLLNQILEVVDHQANLGITITETLIGKRTF